MDAWQLFCCLFFFLLCFTINPQALVFSQPVRSEVKNWGKESEQKSGCWLCRFCLDGTPASRIHHGLMLMAVTDLHPPHHAQIIPQTPTPLIPRSPLSQHGKGDLTQKLGETNDSNESRCPPATVCRHYRCPCEWVQMALFLAWQTAAPLHWTSTGRGEFLPESSCELCVLKSSETVFSLTNRLVSSVVLEFDTQFNLHRFQVQYMEHFLQRLCLQLKICSLTQETGACPVS